MKLTSRLTLCFTLLFAVFLFTNASAQRKKVLKEDIETLEVKNNELTLKNKTLTVENSRLIKENKTYVEEIKRLRSDSVAVNTDYKILADKFQDYKKDASMRAQLEKAANATKTSASYVDPTDKRECAVKQNSLKVDQSYRINLNPIDYQGWGVQIYSYSTLCAAVEKATEFSKSYSSFNTYIRVKQVNGERVFAVIYGSLKDAQQARTYCENFRKNVPLPEAKNAFLVKH